MTQQWIKLAGNWKEGFAYDLHTVSSKHVGHDQYGHDIFETQYTEMGKLINQLKYKYDKTVISAIIDLLQSANYSTIDVIVPAPPSKKRSSQPVFLIAEELGKRLNIPSYYDFFAKKEGSEPLNGMDITKRINASKSTIYIENSHNVSDKNMLLIDDIYETGSTLKVVTDLLYYTAKVKNVYVLTATKTRS